MNTAHYYLSLAQLLSILEDKKDFYLDWKIRGIISEKEYEDMCFSFESIESLARIHSIKDEDGAA